LGVERVFTKDLIADLVDRDDRPWAEWAKGHAITGPAIARLLGRFKIVPGTIRIGATTAKGYRLEQFGETFDRYLKETPK
jgi:putative DNA primase/helicase